MGGFSQKTFSQSGETLFGTRHSRNPNTLSVKLTSGVLRRGTVVISDNVAQVRREVKGDDTLYLIAGAHNTSSPESGVGVSSLRHTTICVIGMDGVHQKRVLFQIRRGGSVQVSFYGLQWGPRENSTSFLVSWPAATEVKIPVVADLRSRAHRSEPLIG